MAGLTIQTKRLIFSLLFIFLICALAIVKLILDPKSLYYSSLWPQPKQTLKPTTLSVHQLTESITIPDLISSSKLFLNIIKPRRDDELINSINDFVEAQKDAPAPNNSLLCCTFGEASVKGLREIEYKLTSSPGCHWAVFIYGGDMSLAAEFDSRIKSRIIRANVAMFQYNISREDILKEYTILPIVPPYSDDYRSKDEVMRELFQKHPYNPKVYSKLFMLMPLVSILSDYEYTWVFDADVSISETDTNHLLKVLRCAFDYPVLVAQPLIYENTQDYHYFNRNAWAQQTDVIAKMTKFIEVQTPIFNSAFLKWYLTHAVGRLLWATHVLGADWGFDGLFCPTATLFAKIKYNANELPDRDKYPFLYSLSNRLIVPCAIIKDIAPVHHRGGKELDRVLGFEKRLALNREMIQNILETFPLFYRGGHHGAVNRNNSILWDPLHVNTTMRASKSLIKNCNA